MIVCFFLIIFTFFLHFFASYSFCTVPSFSPAAGLPCPLPVSFLHLFLLNQLFLTPPLLLCTLSLPFFLPSPLPFLIKASGRISSLLLSSVPLLRSLPLQSPLSEGLEWGWQIVWSWMLILGDRHHMSHSHNHRASLNCLTPLPTHLLPHPSTLAAQHSSAKQELLVQTQTVHTQHGLNRYSIL